MSKFPKVVWVALVGPGGLWKKTPVQCIRNSSMWAHEEQGCWDSKDGAYCIEKLGLSKVVDSTQFASANKAEVEAFIQGVQCAHYMLKEWVK